MKQLIRQFWLVYNNYLNHNSYYSKYNEHNHEFNIENNKNNNKVYNNLDNIKITNSELYFLCISRPY